MTNKSADELQEVIDRITNNQGSIYAYNGFSYDLKEDIQTVIKAAQRVPELEAELKRHLKYAQITVDHHDKEIEKLEARVKELEKLDAASDDACNDCFARNHESVITTLKAQLKKHEWQSIESAPKDGTMFLAWHKDFEHGAGVAYFSEVYNKFMVGNRPQPTLWYPLPTPPKEEENEINV